MDANALRKEIVLNLLKHILTMVDPPYNSHLNFAEYTQRVLGIVCANLP